MSPQLTDMLYTYLGELKAQQAQTFDWMEQDAITVKINAVNLLLGFDTKEKTWFEKVSDRLKELDK